MASIKFSALVSEIKGKFNGSVFASSPSGAYIRNNKSGGGRKSERWSTQKNIMSFISQKWRTLSLNDQEAWNLATVNFPRTNKFGAVRIPSGFELFQSFNTSLLANGQQPVSSPSSPYSFPDSSLIEIDSPDYFQLLTQKKVALNASNSATERMALSGIQILPSQPLADGLSFGFYFQCPFNLANPPKYDERQIVFYNQISDGHDLSVFIDYTDVSSPQLVVQIIDSSASSTYSHTLESTDFRIPKHLIFSFHSASNLLMDLFIDGHLKTITSIHSGRIGAFVPSDVSLFMPIDAQFEFIISILDFRSIDSRVSISEALEWSYGYLSIDFKVLIQLTVLDGSRFSNDPTLNPDAYILIIEGSPDNSIISACFRPYLPLVLLSNDQVVLPNLSLVLFNSPPVSNGITGAFNRKVKFACIDLTSNSLVNVSHLLRLSGFSMPFDTNIRLYTTVLDNASGQQTEPSMIKKKKKVRFKAGAELSDKVN